MAQNPKLVRPDLARPLKFVGVDSALPLYLREIARTKNLTMKEEADLAYRIRQGDRRSLNKLVSANLKFVVSVSRNYQNQGLPLTDLINEGNLGLMRAAQRFDETKSFKFISYAVWWIRQAMLQALAEQSRVINIPLNRIAAIHRIGKAGAQLEQKKGRSVSMSEVSAHLSMNECEIRDCQQLSARPASMDSPLQGEGEGGRLGDSIKDENVESPEDGSLRSNLCDEVGEVLGTLEKREEQVIKLYFGIGREMGSTLEEIGERLCLTRERVRQIKEKALGRLKHATRRKRLAALCH